MTCLAPAQLLANYSQGAYFPGQRKPCIVNARYNNIVAGAKTVTFCNVTQGNYAGAKQVNLQAALHYPGQGWANNPRLGRYL